MPAPRAFAIVTCSCGLRLGDVRKLAREDEVGEAELAMLKEQVPRLVRHWSFGHAVDAADKAPLWIKVVIAKAAREMALANPTDVTIAESGGNYANVCRQLSPTPGQQPESRLPDDDDS